LLSSVAAHTLRCNLCSRSFGPEPRRDGTLITRLSTTLNSRPMLRCVAGGEADEAEPCGSRIPLRQNPAVMNRGAYMERLPPRCTDVRIWHLQGMKLNHANCYLRAIARIPKAGATERVHSGSGAPLARGGMTGSGKGGTAPHGRENGMASGPASGGVSDQGVAWGRGCICMLGCIGMPGCVGVIGCWHARLHLRLRAAVKLPHVVERITVWYTRIEGGDMQSRELRNFSGGAARGFVVVVLQYPDKEQCLKGSFFLAYTHHRAATLHAPLRTCRAPSALE
jgi:hypothetical protein